MTNNIIDMLTINKTSNKYALFILMLLVSTVALSQTTVTLQDQCNCEVLSGTDVSAPGALTPTGADAGDIYVNTDTGAIFFWDGDSWELTSSDDQQLTGFSFNDTTNLLTLDLENGGSVDVDLSALSDTFSDTNTTITSFNIDSGTNSLVITDSDTNTFSVLLADLAAVINTDSQNASEVPFSPAGTLTSNNVQSALEELDAEIIANTNELTTTVVEGTGIDVSSNVVGNNTEYTITVDETDITGDGSITSSDLTVTGGTNSTLEDVTLEIAAGAVGSTEIADGSIASTDIAADAVNAATINADVAGSGLTQNGATGALEVDVTSIAGDGSITSSDLTVTGGTNSTLEDVTLEIAAGAVGSTEIADGSIASTDIAADAVNAATINADVAGSGLTQNGATGALEVDVTSIAGDGSITSPNGTVTLTGTPANSLLEDVGFDVDVTALTGDGSITSSDLTVTGGTNSTLEDVTLEIAAGAVGSTEIADGSIASTDIAADAVNAATINADVAGSGLTQNGATGALEVDVTSIAGDGSITSPNGTVTLTGTPANSLLEDVGFDVDVTALTGDGSITSSDLTVTGGTNSTLEDVTLEIAAGAVGNTELSADAVTTDKIAAGAVESSDIAADAVNAATINADVAGSGLTQNGATGALEVDVTSIAGDGSITSPNGTVTLTGTPANSLLEDVGFDVDVTALTGDGSITSSDLTVTGGTNSTLEDVTLEIAAGAVGNTELSADAVTTDKIAAGAVGSTEIADGSIASTDIAADAVNAATINADVAGSGLTQNGATGALEVDVTSIAGDGSITSPNGTVTLTGTPANSLLEDVGFDVDVSALTGDGSITSSDLTVTGGTNSTLEDVTLEIAAGAVGSTEIADDAVTLSKIENGTSSGQVMQWDGTNWTLVDLGSVTVTENDGVIGNEVTGATNGTLTLSGAGTTIDPLTLRVSDNGITSNEIAADAVNAATINADVAGSGLTQNGATGALEVDVTSIAGDGSITSPNGTVTLTGTPANSLLEDVGFDVDVTALTGDGSITSSDLTVTGGTNSTLEDVTLEIAAGAVGSTEIADGSIASTDIAADAVNAATINADVAGSGLTQNGATGALEVDVTSIAGDGSITSPNGTVTLTGTPANSLLEDVGFDVDVTALTGDGSITSSDLTVTGGTNSTLEDVTLEIAAGAVGSTELSADAVTTDKIAAGAVESSDIAADAVNAATINSDVAGAGLTQNVATGALEVDVTSIAGDGSITSPNGTVTLTGTPANSLLEDVGFDVDVTALTGDGSITSSDLTVTGGTNSTLEDVTLEIAAGAVGSTEIADGSIASTDIAADAVNAATINSDVAGAGLTQNGATGALEVDVASIAGDGSITSPNGTVTLTGTPANSLLEDVGFDVDVTALTGDGSITSSDLTVTGGTNSTLEDVTLEIATGAVGSTEIADGSIASTDIAADAVNAATINADVAGSGLTQNGATGALEVDVASIAGDGSITSPNGTVTLTGTPANSLLEDVGFDVDVTALTGDGSITSSDLTVTGGTNSTLEDVTLEIAAGAVGNTELSADAVTTDKIAAGAVESSDIANDAVNAATINADVAGSGLTQNGATGALEVDVASIAGDGSITSPNGTVTLTGTPANSLLEDVGLDVDVTALTGDGSITSSDLTVTGGTNSTLEDVTLEIATGAVGNTELSADAVTTDKIATGAVESSDIAADAVNAATINSDVAGSGLTQNGATGALEVDVASIAGDGSITSPNGTVTLTGTPANSLLEDVGFDVDVTALIGDGSITSSDLTVTGGTNSTLEDVTLEIAAGAVGNTELSADAVTTDKIATGAVESSDIANDAVNAATINADVAGSGLTQNGATGALEVDVASIAGDGSITSPNGTVTLTGTPANSLLEDVGFDVDVTALIGDGSITSSDLTVTGGTNSTLEDVTLEIAAGAVGNTELSADAVTTDKIATGAVESSDIANDAVNAATINADVAGSGLTQNGATGALEVDVASIAGDGSITSPNGTVTLTGTPANSLLEDVGLDVDVTALTGDGSITSSDLTVTGGTNSTLEDVTLEIAAGAVGNTELSADAVTTDKIAAGAVESSDIANDAVNAATINADVAGSGLTQNGATGALEVDVTSIAGDGSITSPNGTVTLTGTPANSLLEDVGLDVDVTALTGDGSITSSDLTVTGGTNSTLEDVTLEIAAGAVGNTELSADAVTTDKIAAGAVESSDIANDAVNAATINSDVAGSGLTQNGATGALEVDVASIAGDGSITSPNGTVTLTGTPANSLLEDVGLDVDVTALTGDGSITSSDLTVTGGTNSTLEDVTLEIAAGAVGSTEIADDAVTLSKIENGTSSGQVMQWDGTNWTLVDLGSVTVTENDGVIGNEVVNGTDGTLVRSGAGTTLSPYTLDIAADGITNAEIADDAVQLENIADGATVGEIIQWNGSNWVLVNGNTLDTDEQDLGIGIGGVANESVEVTITDGLSTTIDIRDGDFSDTNELTDLSLAGNTLTLTNPATGGNSVTLPSADGTETIVNGGGINVVTGDGSAGDPYVVTGTEVDGSVTNELTDLSLAGNTLTLTNPATGGNSVTLPSADGTETIVNGGGINVVTGDGSAGDPYVVTGTEVDGSVTNELTDLSLAGNTLTLTNPATGGNSVTLPSADGTETIVNGGGINVVTGDGSAGDPYVVTGTEVDGSVTNELTDLSLAGNTLTLTNPATGGNSVTLPSADGTETIVNGGGINVVTGDGSAGDPYVVTGTEVDGSVTNELTDLSLAGNTLTLTNPATGGNSVTLPSADGTETIVNGGGINVVTGDGSAGDPYVVTGTEVDGSVTNELTDLSLAGNTLTLTNPATGGNSVTLPSADGTETIVNGGGINVVTGDGSAGDPYVVTGTEVDGSVTNELTDLSLAGNTLTLTNPATGGNSVTLPSADGTETIVNGGGINVVTGDGSAGDPYVVTGTEVDGSVTNELTDLSLAGNTLTLTNPATGGNSVTLPSADGTETIVNGGTDINVTGDGSAGDPYVVNSTFTEVDGSVTNELTDLSLAGNTLTLTNPATGGNSVTLPSADGTETIVNGGGINVVTGDGSAGDPYVVTGTEVDGSVTNELTDLSLAGNTLTLTNPATGGNSVTLPSADGTETIVNGGGINVVTGDGSAGDPYVVTGTEVDGSVTNELTDLSLAGNTLTLTNPATGGNSVTLPSADGTETIVNGGTDINVTGDGSAGDPYVVNSTFTEVDGSVTNELTDLSLAGNTLTLTNPATGGNSVTLPSADGTETIVNGGGINVVTGDGSAGDPYVVTGTEVDGSVTNELTDLSLAGNTLTLTNPATGGNSVTLPSADGTETIVNGGGINVVTGDGSAGDPYVVTGTEVDGSVTNELTDLSLAGNTLTLTNPATGGNSVTLPSADGTETIVNGGTDINVTGDGSAGDPYVVNSTFTEVDGSVTNELTDLSLAGNTLTLTNPATGGNSVTLPSADGTETIVNGGGINVVTGDGSAGDPYVVTGTEVDGSVTNEINTRFEVNGANLEIEDSDGTLQVALSDLGTDDQEADEVDLATNVDMDQDGTDETNVQAALDALAAMPKIYATGKVAGNGTAASIYGATVSRVNEGDYAITFDSALANANYIINLTILDCGGNCPPTGGPNYDDPGITYYSQTTSGFNVNIGDNDNGSTPRDDVDLEFMFTVIVIPN